MSEPDRTTDRPENVGAQASEWAIPEYMYDILEEDPEIARELLTLFFDTATEIIEQLPVDLRLHDLRSVCRLLHTLKGSTRQLGATDMADFTEAIEIKAGQGDLTGMFESLACLRGMLDSLQVTFQTRVNSLRNQQLSP